MGRARHDYIILSLWLMAMRDGIDPVLSGSARPVLTRQDTSAQGNHASDAAITYIAHGSALSRYSARALHDW
jgi:hypothetical protein